MHFLTNYYLTNLFEISYNAVNEIAYCLHARFVEGKSLPGVETPRKTFKLVPQSILKRKIEHYSANKGLLVKIMEI